MQKLTSMALLKVHIKKLKMVLFKTTLNIFLQWKKLNITIAQANAKIDKNGKILEELVPCRENLNFVLSKP